MLFQGITLTIVPSPTIINADEVVVQVKAVGIDSIDNRIACGYGRLLRRHLGLSAVRYVYLKEYEKNEIRFLNINIHFIGSRAMDFRP